MEAVLIVVFWVAHFVVKVVGTRVGFVHPKDGKLLLAIMVFFFFLRLLYVFAPNSLSLGPRLVMLRKMIQIDLVVFFRLLVVFMCIHGVVSQILLQPYHYGDATDPDPMCDHIFPFVPDPDRPGGVFPSAGGVHVHQRRGVSDPAAAVSLWQCYRSRSHV
ncbi:transient receptor potential cation channel subfamily M member 2-like [Branchiostoma lanceolatum]|uniref:transient receptor potential cation channel subfamily M member 2-like n=1 Tax=Branchiostoma lanceolatum TaxID=7740 RepID=UPI00345501E5